MKGDLHIHTLYSDGVDDPRTIVRYAAKKGLKVIAITDHDTLKGFQMLTRDPPIEIKQLIVVPGIEVTAQECHIITLGVYEEPSFRYKPSVIEVLEWCHSHGGIAVLCHPYGYLTMFCYRIVKDLDKIRMFDAIEGINGRTLMRSNQKALQLAQKLGKPVVGGSDAHRAEEVGYVGTVFLEPIESVDDVLRCIKSGKTMIYGKTYLYRIVLNIVLKHMNTVRLRVLAL